MYAEGEYDLAGFAVGVVARAAILGPARVKAGDALIAIASSGLHSNGYSLARRVLEGVLGLGHDEVLPELGESLGDALLRPTRIYAAAVAALASGLGDRLHALSHITGGGVPGNLPRVFPEGTYAAVRFDHARPPIFELIARGGPVEEEELRRTFNLGIGLIAVVDASAASETYQLLASAGERSWLLGEVCEGESAPSPGSGFCEQSRTRTAVSPVKLVCSCRVGAQTSRRHDAREADASDVDFALVLSNRKDAPAPERGGRDPNCFLDPSAYGTGSPSTLASWALAGSQGRVGAARGFQAHHAGAPRRLPDRILNIHPSRSRLPGPPRPEESARAGAKVAGCTVHFGPWHRHGPIRAASGSSGTATTTPRRADPSSRSTVLVEVLEAVSEPSRSTARRWRSHPRRPMRPR